MCVQKFIALWLLFLPLKNIIFSDDVTVGVKPRAIIDPLMG